MATTLGILTPDNTASPSGSMGSVSSGSMPTSNQGIQPNINNSSTSNTGGLLFSKEDASQVMVDVLRNTSINGVYPTVNGGNIDYALPTGSKASDEWAKQNWQEQPSLNKNEITSLIGQAISKSDIISGDSGQSSSGSNVDIAKSSSTTANSNVDIAKSSSTTANSNIDIAKSSSTVANSNVDQSKSGASSVSDSKIGATESRLPVLSQAEQKVSEPLSDSLSRRKGNESASQQSGMTSMLCTRGDVNKAFLLETHEQHASNVPISSLKEDGTLDFEYYVSGIPVDFYCYKDGKYGYITLSAITKFEEL